MTSYSLAAMLTPGNVIAALSSVRVTQMAGGVVGIDLTVPLTRPSLHSTVAGTCNIEPLLEREHVVFRILLERGDEGGIQLRESFAQVHGPHGVLAFSGVRIANEMPTCPLFDARPVGLTQSPP